MPRGLTQECARLQCLSAAKQKALHYDRSDLMQLRTWTDEWLQDQILSVPGVAGSGIVGSQEIIAPASHVQLQRRGAWIRVPATAHASLHEISVRSQSVPVAWKSWCFLLSASISIPEADQSSQVIRGCRCRRSEMSRFRSCPLYFGDE